MTSKRKDKIKCLKKKENKGKASKDRQQQRHSLNPFISLQHDQFSNLNV